MSELDDIVQMYERDPMNAVIIRLGAMAGTVQGVVDNLDSIDYDLDPDDLYLQVKILKEQVIKTDEMFELWAIVAATAESEEGGEDGTKE